MSHQLRNQFLCHPCQWQLPAKLFFSHRRPERRWKNICNRGRAEAQSDHPRPFLYQSFSPTTQSSQRTKDQKSSRRLAASEILPYLCRHVRSTHIYICVPLIRNAAKRVRQMRSTPPIAIAIHPSHSLESIQRRSHVNRRRLITEFFPAESALAWNYLHSLACVSDWQAAPTAKRGAKWSVQFCHRRASLFYLATRVLWLFISAGCIKAELTHRVWCGAW
jgi:hypothetical protein